MTNLNQTHEYEVKHFKETLQIVNENRSRTDADVTKMKNDIEHMWDQYFAGDTEIWVPLHNTIAMCEQESKALSRFNRASKKPYFGRIIFTDEQTGVKESLYIGRCGINRNITDQVVADWRAPISNVYYENGLGKCTFLSPDDEDINIDLELKRTFDIDNAQLLGYVDSEVVANDELLTKYLARNKQAVLGEIVATIQKEQNDIIRKTPFKNVIVQGAAGSGKTTVAMHRISYILYNYAERITPDRFYIIGSNRMLLNYITGVLPELDVEGVRQMTMEEMFAHILGDAWDEEKHRIVKPGTHPKDLAYRGSTAEFERLKDFCRRLEREYIHPADIVLNRDCFTEGIKNGKTGIYDRATEKGTADFEEYLNGVQKYTEYSSCTRLLPADYIERVLTENPDLSVQKKINLLNEKLSDNLEYEFSSHGSRYTVKEMNAIRKHFNEWFGKSEFNETVFKLYSRYTSENGEYDSTVDSEFDIYDLAAMAYIYKRVIESTSIKMSHHIVIDEAQDYGMMAYRALDFCFEDCTYTVMGDVSQNIRFDSGINNWDELKGLLLTREGDSFCTLRKSYRNTVEISQFATKILDHGDFEVYPVEPIIRHGEEPRIIEVNPKERAARAAEMCRSWQSEGHGTIAIVCRNWEQADRVHKELSETGLELMDNDPERAEFGNGIMVLPVDMTKGLEFDAVLLYEPDRNDYPVDNRHAKLLYVAATRALHELCIVCSGELTGLIADEVPADRIRHVIDADPKEKDDGRTPGEKLREERKRIDADKEYVKKKTLAGATRRTDKLLKGEGSDLPGMTAEVGKIGIPKTEIKKPLKAEDTAETDTSEEVKKQPKENGFASHVPEAYLTPAGHAAPALAAKWVTKQNNGIYIQSRYGILRLCPISAGIMRVSFCAGSSFKLSEELLSGQFGMLKNFTMKDTPRQLDIGMANLAVSVDKQTGAVTFKDGKGRELLKEKNLDTRFVTENKGSFKSFSNFMPKKSNTYYALNHTDNTLKFIGDTAMTVSQDDGSLPLVIVKDSFAILPVTSKKTVFNNLSGRGTALISEACDIDYYFIAADTTERLLECYNKLWKH